MEAFQAGNGATHDEYVIAKKDFARKLNHLMAKLDLTPAGLQARSGELVITGQLEQGVFDANIYKYLHGQCLPNRKTLQALALSLGVTVEELIPSHEKTVSAAGGRRKGLYRPRALVRVRSYGGLERCELTIRCILPAATAAAVAALIKRHLKDSGTKDIQA